jgi:hypothetical protein
MVTCLPVVDRLFFWESLVLMKLMVVFLNVGLDEG